jgi:hypothetical protein
MSRKTNIIIASAAASASLLGVAGMTAASASAATHHVVTTTATTQIKNRPDSGGNGNWAIDRFSRTLVLNYEGRVSAEEIAANPALAATPYKYSAQLNDSGTFLDLPGQFTPNQGGHNLGKVLNVNPAVSALLAALMLRGPQTPGELRTGCDRMYRFADISSVEAYLEEIAARSAGALAVQPLSRLDLELWSPAGGRIGLLARLRDVLPGRYSFGVTGRDPTGAVLPAGDYQLRLVAFGTDTGPPTVRTIGFAIK